MAEPDSDERINLDDVPWIEAPFSYDEVWKLAMQWSHLVREEFRRRGFQPYSQRLGYHRMPDDTFDRLKNDVLGELSKRITELVDAANGNRETLI